MLYSDILDALGGSMFVMSCVDTASRIERGARFLLPHAATRGRLHRVTVTMERNDGFTMRAFRLSALDPVGERHGIETSGLKEAWREMTGIDPERGWICDAMARIRPPRTTSAGHAALAREIARMAAEAGPPPVREPEPVLPPRLLFLACSQTKDPSPGYMPARKRYAGPLWTTLAAADPGSRLCCTAFLSAKLGMGDADAPIPDYERKMTTQTAEAMIARGILQGWPPPEGKRLNSRRMAGPSPISHLLGLRRRTGGEPFREVALVAGRLYLPVMRSYLEAFMARGDVAPDAEVVVVNDAIGRMRQQLRAWVTR